MSVSLGNVARDEKEVMVFVQYVMDMKGGVCRRMCEAFIWINGSAETIQTND